MFKEIRKIKDMPDYFWLKEKWDKKEKIHLKPFKK